MTKEEIIKLFNEAIGLWGADSQIRMMFEEMAELTKSLCKLDRSKNSPEDILNVCEEIVDVEIVLEQMKLIFGNDEYREYIRNQKLERFKGKVEKAKKERLIEKNKNDNEVEVTECTTDNYCLYKFKMFTDALIKFDIDNKDYNIKDYIPVCEDKNNENPTCSHKQKFLFKKENLDKVIFSCLW